MINSIEERRKQIENLNNSEDVVKEKIADAEAEAAKLIEQARADALDMQRKADDLIKKNTEIKLAEADKKAEAIVDSANRTIEKERGSMMEEMKDKILNLSLQINSKVFDKKDANKDFISKEVNSIKV
ncbi:MAG: ATP synthase F0 subunit B [Patescibacteria group bacterium]|nr:ATP synthase F0 subunit B [Patescibacteria group bacterium]